MDGRIHAIRAGVRAMRRCPVTLGYLAVLLATSIARRLLPHHDVVTLLYGSSTDVAHLEQAPVRVLVAALLWLAGAPWLPWAIVIAFVLGPLERRLGTWRTMLVFLSGHVLATALTEGPIALAIALHWLPESSRHRLDIGVSYGLATSTVVLAGLAVRSWRWMILAITATALVVASVIDFDMSEVGHMIAIVVGFAWWPWLGRRGRLAGDTGAMLWLDETPCPSPPSATTRRERTAAPGT